MKEKKLLKLDFLLDDCPNHFVDDSDEISYQGILMAKPWNDTVKDWKYRVRSLSDAMDVLYSVAVHRSV